MRLASTRLEPTGSQDRPVCHPAWCLVLLDHWYFAGRTDGLRPYTVETLVTAQVI